MAKKDFKNEDQQLENVNEALTTAGAWINENQNVLTWSITGILVVVLGIIALNNYVFKPKQLEASNENAKAVVYFQQGDYAKALNGDDAECIGFEAIADKFGNQQGELAALYAGVCYFEQGDYEMAAKYLKKFSADDLLVDPAANMLLGDAYVELEEYGKAASAFRAAAASENDFIAPIALKKLGFVYLEEGKNADARKAFETIKADYATSAEASDIEKYIAIAE